MWHDTIKTGLPRCDGLTWISELETEIELTKAIKVENSLTFEDVKIKREII